MADEPAVVEPAVAVEPAVVVEPVAAVEPLVVVEPVEPAAPVVAEPVKPEDWRDSRIRVLTARLREEQEKNKQAAPTVPDSSVQPASAGRSEAEIRAQVAAELQAQASAKAFNEACNAVAQKGKLAYPDFDPRVNELKKLVTDWNDPGQVSPYNQFLAAAIETGEGEKILHALGGDLDEAARIMSLSPIKMAVELTKMAGGQGAVQLSGAPKPITPVASRNAQHTAIDPRDVSRADNLSTAEWMKRRNEQVAGASKR